MLCWCAPLPIPWPTWPPSRPTACPYAKFAPAEWQYELVGADARFDELSRQLSAQVLGGDRTVWVRVVSAAAVATCVAVLAELRQQRFFDEAAGRPVFLLFSVSDSDPSATG